MTTRGKWLDCRMNKNRTLSKTKLSLEPEGDDVPHYFQVSVNILEGKKMVWGNPSEATSYVVVGLDKVLYRTSVRQNMKVPFYKENFIFEVFTTAREIQRSCLWLSVMEPKCCGAPRLLGEASVDLAYVWRQPHHTMTPKWAQLSLPSNVDSGPAGYLKLDISIALRREVLTTPVEKQNILEDNLLLPYGSEQQPACYQVTVYRAYNVPCSAQSRPDMFGNPPNTCLRVTFCGLMGKTSTQQRSNDPLYSERVSIVDMFPNVFDLIQLEVCSVNGGPKVLASTRLRLSQISHRGGNGFLPTFGPSLLHMYGPWPESSEDGPYYRGSLLVSMKTVVPYYRQTTGTVNVEPVTLPGPETEWTFEDFILYCPVFEVSMLDKTVSGSVCGMAITIGEIPCSTSNDPEFVRQMSQIKIKKLHYTGNTSVRWYSPSLGSLKFDIYPLLQIAIRFPDFRFRLYGNNMLQGIVSDLEDALSNISTHITKNDFESSDLLESFRISTDGAATKILKFLDIIRNSRTNADAQQCSTELDRKLMHLQKEKIWKIYRRITSRKTSCSCPYKERLYENGDCKKALKLMLAEGRAIVQDLKNLIFKIPDGWPIISVWLLSNGSRVAHAEISPADVMHSAIQEQCGRRCGKFQNIYLKPIKCPEHPDSRDCYCISGKVELLTWLGAYRQRDAFQSCLPVGYNLTEPLGIKCEPMNLECCVNIYRAKLVCTSDVMSGFTPFVRVHFINEVKNTQLQHSTMNPIWSEVLRISSTAYTSPWRLENSPPEVLVEVYHCSTQLGKVNLLGRLTVTPVFLNNFDSPPALEWYDILMGTEHVGKIQISAQIIQVSETGMKKTWTNPQTETQKSNYQATQAYLLVSPDGREPLPVNLIPVNNTYKIDVYWWGLRDISITQKPCISIDVEDISINSGIITECRRNCNFLDDRISRIFQGNLSDGYSPLTVKLFDSTTFGRTVFAGLNIVKKPQKYLINWIPKKERSEILYSRSIISDMFMQVSHKTYVVNYPLCENYENHKDTYFEKYEKREKKRDWRRLFSNKMDEEELVLLPVFYKERQNATKKAEDDWWMRYHASLNKRASGDKEPTGNQLMIYDSELEGQPGFSKFKDWCSTIKIYSGNKTGIPEKDEQLRCGYLKASIAIYQWPPPENTVAVSCSGVNLDRGYFDNHPDNDPARYLVRVYVVKCSGLITKGYTTNSKCYVSVQCSSKRLSDKRSGVNRSAEPVFGKMYELRCTFPEDYLLTVSVMDTGPTFSDDLIGSTSIDLEDRAYTRHRSTVGLAAEYNINGPNRWRDSQRPSAILEELCVKNHLPPLQFPDPSTVVMNDVEYKCLQSGFKYTCPLTRKESICLSILQNWHAIPLCGYKLVPQHVETRTLYDPEKPGVEQGKIHMWVDMFPLDSGRPVPAPVGITPRPAENYELRVIVWGVQSVKLLNSYSNIFVKAWIGPCEEAQETDIYYSTNGEGYFNWRMIFQFQYKHSEKKLLIQDKDSLTEAGEQFPPILIIEVLDIDAANPEDILGTLMLDLSAMPRGARLAQHCTSEIMRRHKVDMFVVRSARAWWPLKMMNRNTGNYFSAGMIDLEISLLPSEKAQLMPVGQGRGPPAPLPPPIPRETSYGDYFIGQWNRRNTPAFVGLALMLVGACLYWRLPFMLLEPFLHSGTS